MGYSLTFHAIRLGQLRDALAGGMPQLLEQVMAAPRFPGTIGDAPMHACLADLLGGEIGRRHAAAPPFGAALLELDGSHGQALHLIVEALAPPHAEMIHNSRAGRRFRDEFLDHSLPSAAGQVDGDLLIYRPLFGLCRADYPAWGGLTLGEIRRDWTALLATPPPTLPDDDEDEWLQSLVDGLAGAVDRGTDLVTLYS